MAKIERVSKTWSVRKDLVDRLEEEADARVVGQALIVERALEHFLEGLAPPIEAGTTLPPLDPAFGPKETKA